MDNIHNKNVFKPWEEQLCKALPVTDWAQKAFPQDSHFACWNGWGIGYCLRDGYGVMSYGCTLRGKFCCMNFTSLKQKYRLAVWTLC